MRNTKTFLIVNFGFMFLVVLVILNLALAR